MFCFIRRFGTQRVTLSGLILCCSVGKIWLWSKSCISDFKSQALYLLVVGLEAIFVISLSVSFYHFYKERILSLFIAERNVFLCLKCLAKNQCYFFGFLGHFIDFQDTELVEAAQEVNSHGDSHLSIYKGAQNIVLVEDQNMN